MNDTELEDKVLAVENSVKALLEPAKFKAWLDSPAPAGCTMRRADSEWCPIAHYLDAHDLNVSVEKSQITVRGAVRHLNFPMDVLVTPPAWATEFISLIDDGDAATSLVGVYEAQACLKSVVAGVPSDADDGDAHPEPVL